MKEDIRKQDQAVSIDQTEQKKEMVAIEAKSLAVVSDVLIPCVENVKPQVAPTSDKIVSSNDTFKSDAQHLDMSSDNQSQRPQQSRPYNRSHVNSGQQRSSAYGNVGKKNYRDGRGGIVQNSSSQSSGSNNQQQQQHGQHYQNEAPLKILTKEQLQEMTTQELNVQARRLGLLGASLMIHRDLVEKILVMQEMPDREIQVEGVLEKLPDGFGFLRSPRFDYMSSPDDIYVSPSQIRKWGLRTGDTISGSIRKPKDNEKYIALNKIDKVNFGDPEKLNERNHFDRLSPVHPYMKFKLEHMPQYISTRIMDIFTPIGKGQRGLIVAPPKAGKTVLLKEIAQSLIANNPEIYLIYLGVDERPEEAAEMRRSIKGTNAEVISSTFDEAVERHIQVAEAVLEKAKRLVEVGKDVVILLDSITRLARAYNTVAPASGKVLTGGIDANALQRPKRFFGAARCAEEGGSLTIIATALVETGSRMDEVIYEEFKGTGNMEIHMSRKLANRRVYPAFDLTMSGTRREDLLLNEEELKRTWVLQKFLAAMNSNEAMEFMIDKMKKFKTNEEFFESMISKRPANATTNSNGIVSL